MAEEVQAFLEQYGKDMEKVKQALPEAVTAFGGLFAKVMKDGALSVKQKELIALGIGMAVRCEPCIILHTQKCLQTGATRQEILEAAAVAVVMQGGPTYTHLPRVLAALDALGA